MDIFEKLRVAIGCDYTSDLTYEPSRSKTLDLLSKLSLENCSLHELNDLAEYLKVFARFPTKGIVLTYFAQKEHL